MSASRGSRFWLAAFILLCLAGTIGRTWQMRHWGDALSGVDPFSEANALREVDGFRAQGFWHDAGLGNTLFGPRYPNDGFVISVGEERLHTVTPSGVYTHYPPGPEYLLYLAEVMFGPEPVSRLRLFPLALCGAAAVFYGFSLRRRFGVVAASLVVLASLAVVPFTDANSSVHEYGYALALLLVEIGVAIGRNSLRWPFVLIGFVQGWLSFDQVFLVVLTPLAVELSLPLICPGYKARLRLAIERCILAAAGFALAHLLHFAEVSAFYGSVGAAFADMQDSARWRAGFRQGERVRGFDVIDVVALHRFKKAVRLSCQSSQFPFSRLYSGGVVALRRDRPLWGRDHARAPRPAGAWPTLAVVLDRPDRPRHLLRLVCGDAGPRARSRASALSPPDPLLRAVGDILGGSRGLADRAMDCGRVAKSRDRR